MGSGEMTSSANGDSAIFPPNSPIWRINREHVLLLGGPAAAILQIAHPQVALGVERHSDFRNGTLGRLQRTLDAVYTITFSPRSEVEAMADRVRRSHAPVQGADPQKYSAFSPEAQMWVVATLIQLSIESFERYVGPIPDDERERFYQDMRIFGTYFGLRQEYGPQSWPAFQEYYQAMLDGALLGSLPISRELASHVAYPAKPFFLRALWPVSGAAAREFLPYPLRDKLGLPSTPASRFIVKAMGLVIPKLLPWTPKSLRFVANYLKALSVTPAPSPPTPAPATP
ncbi:hypothetical protein BH09VER1_BH09VER1_22750 [soil metagenome]